MPNEPAAVQPDAIAIAKALKAAGITVRVHKTDRDGNPVKDKETGRQMVIERAAAAADVIAARVLDGGKLRLVTIDGRKHEVAA